MMKNKSHRFERSCYSPTVEAVRNLQAWQAGPLSGSVVNGRRLVLETRMDVKVLCRFESCLPDEKTLEKGKLKGN